MKTITSIDELADVMFKVHGVTTLDNAEFCASMVSCAITVAARDGLGDKAIFDMVLKAATAALVTVRTEEKLRKHGLSLEVH